jgi:hypothetical protein
LPRRALSGGEPSVINAYALRRVGPISLRELPLVLAVLDAQPAHWCAVVDTVVVPVSAAIKAHQDVLLLGLVGSATASSSFGQPPKLRPMVCISFAEYFSVFFNGVSFFFYRVEVPWRIAKCTRTHDT